jgi:hypothetical protein
MSLRRSTARLLGPPLIAAILAVHVDGHAGTSTNSRDIRTPRRIDSGQLPRIVQVAPGTEIEITRRDGVVLRGRYRGIARMTDEEYARHFAELSAGWCDRDSIPGPGSQVEIQPRRGEIRRVTLEGYGPRTIEVTGTPGAPEVIPFDRLITVRVDSGRSWTVKALDLAALQGRVPMSSLLRLRVGTGEIQVPVDEVAQIRDPASNAGDAAAIGVLAGLAGAILVVVLLAHEVSHAECSGPEMPPDLFGYSPARSPDADLMSAARRQP